MSDKPKKAKQKPAKKLELNKETIQELSDEQLDDVAGGALKTGGGHCKQQSIAPACPAPSAPCDTITCASCNIYCG
jgi:natural product precursor